MGAWLAIRSASSCGGKTLRLRRDLVHDAPSQGLFGGRRLPSEDQLLGAPGPDKLAQPASATPAGQGADADLGQSEGRVVGKDSQVARQRQLEPAPVRVAGDGGDGGLSQFGDPIEHPQPKAGPLRPHVQRLEGLEPLDVGAGAEGPVPGAVTTTTRTARSVSRPIRIASSCSSISGVSALCLAGRSRQIVATIDVDGDLADLRCGRSLTSGRRVSTGGVRPWSTWCAPFSPIMVEVAIVLPLISLGMMEASITRRPSMPCTLSSWSTTASSSSPILQRADRVVVGLGPLPDVLADLRCRCGPRRRAGTP